MRIQRQRADWKFRARYEPVSKPSAFGQTGDAKAPRKTVIRVIRFGLCFERLREFLLGCGRSIGM